MKFLFAFLFCLFSFAENTNLPLTSNWYFQLTKERKETLAKVFRKEPFNALLQKLPEALYYQDQRESFGRAEINPGQLVQEVSVHLQGFGTVYIGFSSIPEEPRELWLVTPNKNKYLLAKLIKDQWEVNAFLPLPKTENHWTTVSNGVLFLNEANDLFFQHHDPTKRTLLNGVKTLDGTPIQHKVAIHQLKKDVATPLWYIDNSTQQVLLASCIAETKCKKFDVVLYNFFTGTVKKVESNLSWPIAFTNRGLYYTQDKKVIFNEMNWEKSELAKAKTVFNLFAEDEFKSKINQFIISRQNAAGTFQEYSLNPEGNLERYFPSASKFKNVDLTQHERIQEFEFDGTQSRKVDLLEELTMGARTPRYGIQNVAEQLASNLGATKNNWVILVYQYGQNPEDIFSDFVWKLKTNALAANPELVKVHRVYNLDWKSFDLKDAEEVNKRIQTLSEVLTGTYSIGYLADFPATHITGVGGNAEKLNQFEKHFSDCLEAGTCRVVMSMQKEVYEEVDKTLRSLLRRAKVVHIPSLDTNEKRTIAESHRLSIERKLNKRLSQEAVDFLFKYLFSESYRSPLQSPERELAAIDDLFDHLKAFHPEVSQINRAALDTWIDQKSNTDIFRKKLNPDKICNELRDRVVSHDAVIDSICNLLKSIKAGVRLNTQGPLAKYIFIGPSGVGKTFIPEILADLISGKQDSLLKIDMASFKGLNRNSPLYLEMTKNPGVKMVLFDDIDQLKSNSDTLQQLADILDSGFYGKGTENEIDFRNTIVFWTANWAQEVINQQTAGDSEQTLIEKVKANLTIANNGRQDPILNPRVWGRIESALHLFPRLTEPELLEVGLVVTRQLIYDIESRHDKKIKIDPQVLMEMAASERASQSAARGVKNRIVTHIFKDKNFQAALIESKVKEIAILQNNETDKSSSRIEVVTNLASDFKLAWEDKKVINLTGWHKAQDRAFVCEYLKTQGAAAQISSEQMKNYLKKYDVKGKQ